MLNPLPAPTQPLPLLGGLSPNDFMARYWQKQPLLVRGAVQQFDALPTLAELRALAAQDDVEARLVEYRNERWQCESGPFRPARHKKLAADNWTLLVQSVNFHIPFCHALLHRFGFIPQVRLDDLMISHAPPGGSVGPHFDSYDVFLLQVGGRKRWQIAAGGDRSLVPDAPLKILQHFQPEQEWVLEHGDMLYLPPRFAHYGVALDEGQTWSIGFRAPSQQELATAFLDYLRDHLALDGLYADPDLCAVTEPGRIPPDFTRRIDTLLRGIDWPGPLVAAFVGSYFSEPKPQVLFDPPDDPLDEADFAAAAAQQGLALHPKSLLLFDSQQCYLNGETLPTPAALWPVLQQLANQRHLPGHACPAELAALLWPAYDSGYLVLAEPAL